MPAYDISPDALTEHDKRVHALNLADELEELQAQKWAAEDEFASDTRQCILAMARDQNEEAEHIWAKMTEQRATRIALRKLVKKMGSTEHADRSDTIPFQRLAQAIFGRAEAPLATASTASCSSKRKADDLDTGDKPPKKARIARKPVPRISS